ncbi:RNA-binding protein [Candidatus Saccharibacteria bacterium]|nr:RNA-binding protein [Candidatus Saccharibacteria bacterium]
MAMKLYVGGLAYATTEKELEELFATHGAVTSAIIIKDRDTGQSKGFGFVEMADVKDGQTAIKEIDGKEVAGRKLNVNQARERDDSAPRRDSNGGGNSFRRSY